MANEPDNKRVKLVEKSDCPSGVQLVNSFRTNRVDCMDLVELAAEIQNADKFVQANVSNKLQVIAEQVRFLQQQAKNVLREAKDNQNLHHVACNFVKKPGHIYYLCRKVSGEQYFSMLSPQEWGMSCPHEYLGAFRLEYDHSWTPESQFQQKTEDNDLIKKILTTTNTLAVTMGE